MSHLNIADLRKQAFALAAGRGLKGDDALHLLHDVAGAGSLTQLDVTAWAQLVATLGGTVAPKSHLEKPANVSEKQWGYIHVLRKQLQQDDTAFIRFVKHTTKLEHPRFLDAESARILIHGLNRAISTRRP